MRKGVVAKGILSQKAYAQICECVTGADNQFEVGGVLLGYHILKRYYIVAATTPGKMLQKSRISFVLDGEWHTACAQQLMGQFLFRPSIVGIWHSHICGSDAFSQQDRKSHEEFSCSFPTFLSMIVLLGMPQRDLSLTAYLIFRGGKERPCRIEVSPHGKGRLLPALPARFAEGYGKELRIKNRKKFSLRWKNGKWIRSEIKESRK